MRIMVFALKFVFLAAFFIISTQNLALIEEENRDIFVQEYGGWVYSVVKEVGTLTGYVVDVEWLPEGGNSESFGGGLFSSGDDRAEVEVVKYTDVKR